jgi:2-C-methyl-D-erythritol 4-phosphate cytidylyltransferase
VGNPAEETYRHPNQITPGIYGSSIQLSTGYQGPPAEGPQFRGFKNRRSLYSGGVTSAVIVAAGRGIRMGGGVEKLLLLVAGRPVVWHAWALFEGITEVHEVVLVVREGMEDFFSRLAQDGGFKKPFRFALGGQERQDSVWNGLDAISPRSQWVAIQDGARPCTTPATVRATLAAARRTGAAVAGRRMTDTVKEEDGQGYIARTIDRSRLWSVQTPQAFRVDVIRQALAEVRSRGVPVTDDTAACEWTGQPVELVETPDPNPKVTVPADLVLVELLLQQRAAAAGGEQAKG